MLLAAIADCREQIGASWQVLSEKTGGVKKGITLDCKRYDTPQGAGIFFEFWLEYELTEIRVLTWSVELTYREADWEVCAALYETDERGQSLVAELSEGHTPYFEKVPAMLHSAASAVLRSVTDYCSELKNARN